MLTTAVIIDDEKNNIHNLSIMLREHCPQLEVIGSATNAIDAQKLILTCNPDIVFLDIQMPGKNGLEMLSALKTHNFELIFVTAFDQYGIQAVKFSAIDYLLKPVSEEELKNAAQKAVLRSLEKKQNTKLENLLDFLQNQQQKHNHRIALTSAKETRFIKVVEIIRCESTNNYTTFYILNGERIMTSKPIFEYEEMLQEYGFIRCHQTHLVNKRFVKSLIKQDGGSLLLEDDTLLPISRLKREIVKKELGDQS